MEACEVLFLVFSIFSTKQEERSLPESEGNGNNVRNLRRIESIK